MGKRDHAKPGSRDHCFHCNEIIELFDLSPEKYRQTLRWHHLEPAQPGLPDLCPQVEILDQSKWAPRTKATPRLWCSESVETSWHYNLCNRPATVPEWHMCGIHGAHERKRREKEEKEQQEAEEQAYVSEVLDKTIEYLKEEYDIDAEKHYYRPHGDGWRGRYTGKIIVNPKQLVDILDELLNMEAL